MQIYYSSLCKIRFRITESLDEMIRYGSTAVELMLYGVEWNEFENHFENHGAELANLLAVKPLTYSVHIPVWDMNLTSENAQARQAVREAYHLSIVFASIIHATHVVIHPGFCYAPAFDKKEAQKRTARAIKELCHFNSSYGIPLLVENVGNLQTSIFTQDEYIRFIDDLEDKSKRNVLLKALLSSKTDPGFNQLPNVDLQNKIPENDMNLTTADFDGITAYVKAPAEIHMN